MYGLSMVETKRKQIDGPALWQCIPHYAKAHEKIHKATHAYPFASQNTQNLTILSLHFPTYAMVMGDNFSSRTCMSGLRSKHCSDSCATVFVNFDGCHFGMLSSRAYPHASLIVINYNAGQMNRLFQLVAQQVSSHDVHRHVLHGKLRRKLY